jgi:hypothetical protein
MPQSVAEQRAEAQRASAQNRLKNKTYSNAIEVRDPWVYFDTYTLDAATADTELFNNAAAKARHLSNYPYQQIPMGQAFDISGLRVSYFGHAAHDDTAHLALLTFLNGTSIELQVHGKVPVYQRNLAAMFGGQIQVLTAPAVTVNSRNLSVWTGNTVVKLKEKVYLDENARCKVTIIKNAANAAALTGDFLRVEWIGCLTGLL